MSLEKLLGRHNDEQAKLLRQINKDDENKANKMNLEYNFIPTDEEQDNYIKTSLEKLLHNNKSPKSDFIIGDGYGIMMCYSDCDGIFPLTMDECKSIQKLCSERISELESNIGRMSPHIYINLKMIEAKMNGYAKLMDLKKNEEQCPRVTDLYVNDISKAEGD